MNLINQYSVVLLVFVGLAVAMVILLRRGINPKRLLILVLMALGVFAAWRLARPVQTDYSDLADLRAQIGAGRPVLLEFQSPY